MASVPGSIGQIWLVRWVRKRFCSPSLHKGDWLCRLDYLSDHREQKTMGQFLLPCGLECADEAASSDDLHRGEKRACSERIRGETLL